MNTYERHRFPPDIISYAVWLYFRFNLGRVETVIATLKIYWLNAVSSSVVKQFVYAVSSSVHSMLED